jgi:hypothetical protein
LTHLVLIEHSMHIMDLNCILLLVACACPVVVLQVRKSYHNIGEMLIRIYDGVVIYGFLRRETLLVIMP